MSIVLIDCYACSGTGLLPRNKNGTENCYRCEGGKKDEITLTEYIVRVIQENVRLNLGEEPRYGHN